MKTSVLLACIGAGVGTLGGGGSLAYHLLQKETVTVKDTLNKKGHQFLSFKEGEALDTWKEIAKAYGTSTKNKLGNLNITKPQDENSITDEEAKALQKACKDLVNNSEYKDADLLSAEQWCVKPITIQELISKHRKILTLDKTQDVEQTEWDTKVDEYLADGAENKLPDTTLKTRTIDNKKADREKLKADCTKAKDKKTHDADFHENYTPFYEWCTIPQVNG